MGYRLLIYPRLLKEISQTVSEVLGELAENAFHLCSKVLPMLGAYSLPFNGRPFICG
jgi:hypothetical protein